MTFEELEAHLNRIVNAARLANAAVPDFDSTVGYLLIVFPIPRADKVMFHGSITDRLATLAIVREWIAKEAARAKANEPLIIPPPRGFKA